MVRRVLTGLLVLVALPVLLALSPVLLVAYLVWSPVAARAARRNAQAAVDRLFPGEIRVTGAHGRGEAGGYNVDAVLLADPSVDLGWKGERRCDGGLAPSPPP